MHPAMRMSSGRYFVRAAMRASSFSHLALSSWLRAYAAPCSAGSIGGLSAMSCIWSASSSRRFRSAAVGAAGTPRSLCSVWIRSQSGSIWISTHFHRFARRSAVFFSSASASFTRRPRSSRYTASSSNWLNRSRCTRPPAFSYASSPTNEASPLLPITAPSVSCWRMCSGHVVPPPRAFAQTSSCALRSSVTVKAIRVWRFISPLRNAASSSGATVPSRIIFVTCRSLTPARDAISAAVMPLARSRAYASYWSAGCIAARFSFSWSDTSAGSAPPL